MSDSPDRSDLSEETSAEAADPQSSTGKSAAAETTPGVATVSSEQAPSAVELVEASSRRTKRLFGLAGLVVIAVLAILYVVPLLMPAGDPVPEDGAGAATQEILDNPFMSTGPPRRTLEGNWVLIITQPDQSKGRFDEICSGLFGITSSANSYTGGPVRLLGRTSVFPNADLDLESTFAEDKDVRFVFEEREQRFDFEGRLLEDGIVYGNIIRGDVCQMARLLPTDQKELDANIAVVPTMDRPKLDQVMIEAKKQRLSTFEMYRMFCREHSDTTLAHDISLQSLIKNADPSQMSPRDFEKLADEHNVLAERWGPRMQAVNKLILGHAVHTRGYPPEVSLKLIEGLDELLRREKWGEAFLKQYEYLHARARGTRARFEAEDALKKLDSEDGKDQAASLATLRELHQQFPFSHFITYGLAEQAEKAKRLDEAIALYGEIVALPLLERLLEFEWNAARVKRPLPGDTLARLWKQKHGDTKGLPAYLEQVYRQAIEKLAGKPPAEPPSGNRVVLCEMFTSVRADPAIASELSTAALQRRFGADRFVVVRFHPLAPAGRDTVGGDPLANGASLTRLVYYQGLQVPQLWLDGSRHPDPEGLLANLPSIHRYLSTAVEKRLASESAWTLKLFANESDGMLTVTAEATGKTPATESQRLRLLLVESHVSMPRAVNGVRRQDMVVRAQLDDSDGVESTDGEFAFDVQIKLDDIRKQLTDDLVRYERRQGMEFAEKPLDLKGLHVVGFVQDNTTREVLQAAIIKVTPKAKPSP